MKTIDIMIADDDPSVRRLLERMLRGQGLRTRSVPDGMSALKEARVRKPDLLILDVGMPGLNGHAVCSALRGDRATRDIPILMLTGLSGVENEMEGLHQGADAYVAKPFEAKTLFARINALLRRCGIPASL